MNNLREKLLALSGGETSNWKEKVEYQRKNRQWIEKSSLIALTILEALDSKGLSQKDLAERMGISPQQINKIVSGQENLTLETIIKLESVLGIKIIEVKNPQSKVLRGRKNPAA